MLVKANIRDMQSCHLVTFVGGASRACALNRSKQLPRLQPLANLSRMASDLAVDRATPSPDQSRYVHVISTRWRACCYIHVESDFSIYTSLALPPLLEKEFLPSCCKSRYSGSRLLWTLIILFQLCTFQ